MKTMSYLSAEEQQRYKVCMGGCSGATRTCCKWVAHAPTVKMLSHTHISCLSHHYHHHLLLHLHSFHPGPCVHQLHVCQAPWPGGSPGEGGRTGRSQGRVGEVMQAVINHTLFCSSPRVHVRYTCTTCASHMYSPALSYRQPGFVLQSPGPVPPSSSSS